MRLNNRWMIGLAVGMLVWTVSAQADEVAMGFLKQTGAVAVAAKESYGVGIAEMLLGYDAEGNAIAGVAARETATYYNAMMYVTVIREGNSFKIQSMDAPDVVNFRGKSRDYAESAMKEIAGKTLAGAAEARGLVDAVSGATPQLKAIYVSAARLASKIIDELQAAPNWERKPIP